MKQYLDLLENILQNGVEKESGRENMPPVIGIDHGMIEMDLRKGFPLLTTKKMYLKGIITELIWFMRGDTNIKYLIDNDTNIWNKNAYKWYKVICERNKIELFFMNVEEFVDFIKRHPVNEREFYNTHFDNEGLAYHLDELSNINYKFGDLGKVYGYQWRDRKELIYDKDGDFVDKEVDQLKKIVDGLRTNPYSRYHILDAWNPMDFDEMALPPCHLLYQFIVTPISQKERVDMAIFHYEVVDCEWEIGNIDRMLDKYNIPKFYLNLNMYQRSCDTLLGVPFNIASMSILLMIIANMCNMVPKTSRWIGGDVHIYRDHIEIVIEQSKRKPLALPELVLNRNLQGSTLEEVCNTLEFTDFDLVGYEHHSRLGGELYTGLEEDLKDSVEETSNF